MYFANPWGLLGLLSLPAILAIHLYHRRFPPLQIAGLHLWGLQTRKESPGRTREKLPWTRTLFLELLAALLITLLIADPRDSSLHRKEHLVLVLDNSASMSAIDPETGESTRDRSIKWIKNLESRYRSGGLVSILTTGRRPTLIAGPRADWQTAIRDLEKWNPRETRHEFEPAWDLGNQLSDGQAEFYFLTDKLPEETSSPPLQMGIESFGKPLNNVSITSARWSYDPAVSEGTLFVRIANLSKQTSQVTMTASSQNHSLVNEEHELSAGAEKSLEWILPGGLQQLELTTRSAKDPLSIDNQVLLIEPQVRLVNLAVTLPSTHPAFEGTRRILGVIPQTQLGDPDEADLIIAPASDRPVSKRGLWWVGMGPIDLEEESRSAEKTLLGPYLIEKNHPIVEGIVLGGVVWGGVQPTSGTLIPIISTGSSLLLSQWQNLQSTAFLLNIDINSSNLTESPDWPIFWTNLVELCRNSRPGFRRWNFHLEESIPFTLSNNALNSSQPLRLIFGTTERPLIRSESVEISPRDEVGLYEVRDGNKLLGKFAVNFLDREESNLLSLKTDSLPAREQPEVTGIHWDNPFSWLIMLGILLVMIAIYANWHHLRRRT